MKFYNGFTVFVFLFVPRAPIKLLAYFGRGGGWFIGVWRAFNFMKLSVFVRVNFVINWIVWDVWGPFAYYSPPPPPCRQSLIHMYIHYVCTFNRGMTSVDLYFPQISKILLFGILRQKCHICKFRNIIVVTVCFVTKV